MLDFSGEEKCWSTERLRSFGSQDQGDGREFSEGIRIIRTEVGNKWAIEWRT